MAKLVDATDLKSVGPIGLCGFDSRRPHQIIKSSIENVDDIIADDATRLHIDDVGEFAFEESKYTKTVMPLS